MKFGLFLILQITLFNSSLFSQTCVIAVRKNDAVYVGADSRLTVYLRNKHGGLDTVYNKICKLYSVNGINFAVINHLSPDAVRTAKDVCNSQTRLTPARDLYIDRFRQFLTKKLELLRQTDMNTYKKDTYKNESYYSQILFFGFEDGKTIIYSVGFSITNPPNLPVNIKIDSQMYDAVSAGKDSEIYKIVTNVSTWNDSEENIIKKIHDLILKQSHVSIEVGGPITIMCIKKDGIKWIPSKNICN